MIAVPSIGSSARSTAIHKASLELLMVASIEQPASQLEESALKLEFDSRLTGWLLVAGLVLTSTEALAANGFSVTTSGENVIAIGMSTSEVRQLLGTPARTARYGNTPGPVWTYKVVDPLFGRTEFNVEFSADDRVIAKGEYVIGNESPNGGQRD